MIDEIHVYSYFFFFFVILYADDTIILAESKDALQAYCECWKLEVNVNKTKAVTFCRRKHIEFYFGGEKIDSYAYLGVIFKYKDIL